MAAFDELGTVGVELNAEGLVGAARGNGMATTVHEFELPAADIDLVARTGDRLDVGFCGNDTPDSPIVELEYRPVSGHLTLTLIPYDGEEGAHATAEFKDVVWEVEGGILVPAVTMPTLEIRDALVGFDVGV